MRRSLKYLGLITVILALGSMFGSKSLSSMDHPVFRKTLVIEDGSDRIFSLVCRLIVPERKILPQFQLKLSDPDRTIRHWLAEFVPYWLAVFFPAFPVFFWIERRRKKWHPGKYRKHHPLKVAFLVAATLPFILLLINLPALRIWAR